MVLFARNSAWLLIYNLSHVIVLNGSIESVVKQKFKSQYTGTMKTINGLIKTSINCDKKVLLSTLNKFYAQTLGFDISPSIWTAKGRQKSRTYILEVKNNTIKLKYLNIYNKLTLKKNPIFIEHLVNQCSTNETEFCHNEVFTEKQFNVQYVLLCSNIQYFFF